MFYDLETTGLDPENCAIHQISAIIEVDYQIVEEINLRMRPHMGADISKQALEIGGVSFSDLMRNPLQYDQITEFKRSLGKHVVKYDPKDKYHIVGFCNRNFDDKFLRNWFSRNEDNYYGSWFWSNTQDVSVIASTYLEAERSTMHNFKLGTVASELGIEVDTDELHDATYDVRLTRDIYNSIRGFDIM